MTRPDDPWRGGYPCPHCPHRAYVRSLLDQHIRQHHAATEEPT